jgi:hypothetical protein
MKKGDKYQTTYGTETNVKACKCLYSSRLNKEFESLEALEKAEATEPAENDLYTNIYVVNEEYEGIDALSECKPFKE